MAARPADRVAYVARLKPGSSARARELVEAGPPFDPVSLGFDRHTVFVGGDLAIFVFEGGRPGLLVETVAAQADESILAGWEDVLDGLPEPAWPVYSWAAPRRSAG